MRKAGGMPAQRLDRCPDSDCIDGCMLQQGALYHRLMRKQGCSRSCLHAANCCDLNMLAVASPPNQAELDSQGSVPVHYRSLACLDKWGSEQLARMMAPLRQMTHLQAGLPLPHVLHAVALPMSLSACMTACASQHGQKQQHYDVLDPSLHSAHGKHQ